MEVRLLGPLEVVGDDGCRAVLRGRKLRATPIGPRTVVQIILLAAAVGVGV